MSRVRGLAVTLTMLAALPAAAEPCAVLAARVDAVPGAGPALLNSYDDTSAPALRGAAFTYDNAAAAIALVACGRVPQATRIGEALAAAALFDRSGEPGRLRNAYRAGPQAERPVPPMGWWDKGARRWLEDPYQVGSATGNVAWGALALLTVADATGQDRFRDAAAAAAGWAAGHGGAGNGFSGGVQGWDGHAQVLGWKSTEHNVDLAAVFHRLGWREPERRARAFLDAMWAAGGGHFPTGTLPDGVTVNRKTSGLDAQLWPLLLDGAPAEWRRALNYAERVHGVNGGFDFNDDRDGLWVEGTAQAALAYTAVGRADKAAAMLATVSGQASPGGYAYATREPSITTGLAIGPDSTTDDFRYYRLPHLGATAWAALAGQGFNPFTGRRLK
jgi:hypothetical protein